MDGLGDEHVGNDQATPENGAATDKPTELSGTRRTVLSEYEELQEECSIQPDIAQAMFPEFEKLVHKFRGMLAATGLPADVAEAREWHKKLCILKSELSDRVRAEQSFSDLQGWINLNTERVILHKRKLVESQNPQAKSFLLAKSDELDGFLLKVDKDKLSNASVISFEDIIPAFKTQLSIPENLLFANPQPEVVTTHHREEYISSLSSALTLGLNGTSMISRFDGKLINFVCFNDNWQHSQRITTPENRKRVLAQAMPVSLKVYCNNAGSTDQIWDHLYSLFANEFYNSPELLSLWREKTEKVSAKNISVNEIRSLIGDLQQIANSLALMQAVRLSKSESPPRSGYLGVAPPIKDPFTVLRPFIDMFMPILPFSLRLEFGRHCRALMEESDLCSFWIGWQGALREYALTLQWEKVSANPGIGGKKEKKRVLVAQDESNSAANTRGKCPLHPDGSNHYLNKCRDFLSKSVEERREFAKNKRLCFICLHSNHSKKDCKKRSTLKCLQCDTLGHATSLCLKKDESDNSVSGPVAQVNKVIKVDQQKSVCNDILKIENSKKILFENDISDVAVSGHDVQDEPLLDRVTQGSVNVAHDVNNDFCVAMPVQAIFVAGVTEPARTLWDSGAEISLVTKEYARRNNLVPQRTNLELSGVTGSSYSSKLYSFYIVDKDGKKHAVNAYEHGHIAKIRDFDKNKVANEFNIDVEELDNSQGEVDLLLGADNAVLHPQAQSSGLNCILSKSIFSEKSMVMGITSQGGKSHWIFSEKGSQVFRVQVRDFWEQENVLVAPPKRCNKCKSCTECPHRACVLSWAEQAELAELEKGLVYSPKEKIWTATYPKLIDLNYLIESNNRSQVEARMIKLESKLKKEKFLDCFNSQFKEACERGIYRELTAEEIKSWDKPVFYCNFAIAMKDSETTPIRICTDGTQKYLGKSLNDILPKGPKIVNSTTDVLMKFRCGQVGVIADLAKFYNTVKSDVTDQHLRRMIWRDGEDKTDFREFVTTAVNFGDRPAGAVAMLALRNTAEMFSKISEKAAGILRDSSYVDDVGYAEECMQEAVKTQENLTAIAEKGNFTFKEFVFSGQSGDPRKFLGLIWDTENDSFSVDFKVNISIKRRGVRMEQDFELSSAWEKLPSLTKRNVWSICLSIFDLVGFFQFFVIQLKLLMRKICVECAPNWDANLPDNIDREFRNLLKILPQLAVIKIPRNLAAPNPTNLSLCGFSDASSIAMAAVVYLRSVDAETGEVHTRLIASKAKVAPKERSTIPRLELTAMVMLGRMVASIKHALNYDISHVYLHTDSTVALQFLTKKEGVLNEFVGNRVGDILTNTNAEDWKHVSGDQNIADIGTRDACTVQDLEADGIVQRGPSWLLSDPASWPVKEISQLNVKPEELRVEYSSAAKKSLTIQISNVFDPDKYGSFKRSRNILAYILLFIHKKLRHATSISTCREEAETILFCRAQEGADMMDNKNKYLSLAPVEVTTTILKREYTVIKMKSRIPEKALEEVHEKSVKPIIPHSCRLAVQIMTDAHDLLHSGVDRCVLLSRRKAWITQARRLARTITKRCYTCRRRFPITVGASMGPVTEDRAIPSFVFDRISLDLFGPLHVKDHVNARSHRKVFGLVICCQLTQATWLGLLEDYSKESFLTTFSKFCDTRGAPTKILSDRGTQLSAASRDIISWLSKSGRPIEWTFTPVGASHFNGLAERAVGQTKQQLKLLTKSPSLSFCELDGLLIRVAALLNSRPLGLRPSNSDEPDQVFTPNLFLIGRPDPEYQDSTRFDTSLGRRVKYVDQLFMQFKKSFFSSMFQGHATRTKWKRERRNFKIGDVVLMCIKDIASTTWKLGKVVELKCGKDNVPRRLMIEFMVGNSRKQTEKSPHQLAILVPADETEESG